MLYEQSGRFQFLPKLRYFAAIYFRRPKKMDVTLIDVQSAASYSGMVPGCVSGLYKPEDTLLQLQPLADWADIEFINDKVVDIDLDQKVIHLDFCRYRKQ